MSTWYVLFLGMVVVGLLEIIAVLKGIRSELRILNNGK